MPDSSALHDATNCYCVVFSLKKDFVQIFQSTFPQGSFLTACLSAVPWFSAGNCLLRCGNYGIISFPQTSHRVLNATSSDKGRSLLGAWIAAMSTKSVISTPSAPAAIGPYSQGVVSNGILFCSGQIAIDPATGNLVAGGIEAQAEQVCKNVSALLKAAGLGAESVLRTTVYLADIKDFPVVNEIYARYFTEPYPARSCVAVAALPKGALVEIEVTAAAK